MLTIIAALMLGQTYEVSSAPRKVYEVQVAAPKAKSNWDIYVEGVNASLADGKPLVVGVSTTVPTSSAWHSVRVSELDGELANTTVVCVPDGKGWVRWVQKFEGQPTIADVLRVSSRDAVRSSIRVQEVPRFVPFPEAAAERPIAEAKDATGPWHLVSLPEMKFYQKARYVQRIAITNGRDSNNLFRIDQDDVGLNFHAVNPNRIFPWAVSGGMHNMSGWKSSTAVHLPSYPKVFTEYVEAGASRRLPKTGWSFPDGTVFADVLSTDRGVFEIRTRSKLDGNWRNKVAYRNPELAPHGYSGAGKACNECHDHAGSSKQYGVLIRGADETFSWAPNEISR